MVREVEVERVGSVVFRLEVQVTAGAVRLAPAGRVEERHEERPFVATIERLGGQPVRIAVDVEPQSPGAMRGTKLVIRRRDLEVRRLIALVGLEKKVVEP